MKNKKTSPVLQPCSTDDSFRIDYEKKLNPLKIRLNKDWIKKVQNENVLLYQKGLVSVTVYKNSRIIIKNCKNKTLAQKILNELIKNF